jgi:hypothetical protein
MVWANVFASEPAGKGYFGVVANSGKYLIFL